MTSRKESLNKCVKHLAKNFVLHIVVMGETDQVATDHQTPARAAFARKGVEHVDEHEMQCFHAM